MVSQRCKLMVKEELVKLGLAFFQIELGMVELSKPISSHERELLKLALHKSGLELMRKGLFLLRK